MIKNEALFKLSYGLFVLTAKAGDKDNGCIINTAQQVTSSPLRISITVNKSNFTHDMIVQTGEFNLSVLTEETPFEVIRHYGFQSGRDVNKIVSNGLERSENGIAYIKAFSNSFISAKVIDTVDLETHTLFIADVTEAEIISEKPSLTYEYYFKNIKPKPENKKKGFVCKICGYVYDGDELPADFVCPICKHGASDFEPV